jgi:hypothetical protein
VTSQFVGHQVYRAIQAYAAFAPLAIRVRDRVAGPAAGA